MGLEDKETGANAEDIIKAIDGFLQEEFNFDRTSSMSEKDLGYRSNPSVEDQATCLVNIIAADKISLMNDGVIDKLKNIRQAATDRGIPQVIIMTRTELACPLVQWDIKKIYTSKKIKEKMEVCSNQLGIPMNNIFPVKNYNEEIDTDDDMDLLILKALDQIVNNAADLLKKQSFNSGVNTNSSEFDQPWRKMPWGKKDQIEQKLRSFRLKGSSARFVRILVVGEVGAGKSSFIDSVNNAFQGRITSGALVDRTGGTSFTKKYKTHYIEAEDGSHLHFVFNDVMGLEDKETGANAEDIIKSIDGFLQEGFNFDRTSSMSEKDLGYRSNPSVEDQATCLVNIIAADKISLMNDGVIDKLKNIRQAATDRGIPQVIIMTRTELACPLVQWDIKKIYTSKKIKEKMEVCSNQLGIPMNNIFPVKNYNEEIDTDDDMDLLILKALDQIVNNAADLLKKQSFNSGVNTNSSEFDQPWRKMPWGKKDQIEQKLRSFRLKGSSARFVRILVVGEVGAGKSSFIDSVNNAFQGRITSGALVDRTGGTSFTKKYKTHYIKAEDGSHLPFVFNDVMGLEDKKSGADAEDIFRAIDGFLQEGFNFDHTSSMSEKDLGYRSNPSVEDQATCLVNIIAADKISLMNDGVIDKLKKIREKATVQGIPQVIIMTRPELACPLVHRDIRKIYTSKKIKEKMEMCSNQVGIPMSHIFPVKNYHEEIDTDDDLDLLILKALDQIVNMAADLLMDQSFNSSEITE
ncbi:uncharacterized protein LOC131346536 isoform X2 [Hemibagrus wyckioides]|nr:uncharacterized protein LOC131346536 isoform X2 [Hemibagrus wyckioides]